MSFPIETIFAILAIEVFRALAQQESLAPPPLSVVGLVTAGWIVWSYVSAAAITRRTRRRLRRAQGSTVEILEDFRFRVTIHKVVLVALCIAYVAFTQWPAVVEDVLKLPSWSIVDDLAAIAPFVGAMVAGWAATFRLDRALSRRSWGLGEYIWFQARYSLLLVLGPWVALKGIDDSRALWPAPVAAFFDNAVVSALFFAAIVVVAAAFLPVFLTWLFRAVSMPPGPMRERLEQTCERAGMKFRDILIWRMERARILNAGVMGVIPHYRYVMFSDALLEALQPGECEAVLAHEIAHSKFRHPVVYLLFTLGFVAFSYDAIAMLPPIMRSDYLWQMPILAILVVVYFRFVFGYLSRAFERQADVYAAGLMGTPVPLILALEKIALMSGDIRELRSWRHHSVGERVRHLSLVGYDPVQQQRYHAGMRKLSVVVALGVALLIGGASYVWMQEPEGASAKIAVLRNVVAGNPTKWHVWLRLAELETGRGRPDAALEYYGQALHNNPGCRAALDGLTGLAVSEDAKHRTLAGAFSDAGYSEAALEHARAGVELNGLAPENHLALARALVAAGDRPGAIAALRAGLEAVPGDNTLGSLLAKLSE